MSIAAAFIIHKNQELEATQMSINKRMDKQIVIHIFFLICVVNIWSQFVTFLFIF